MNSRESLPERGEILPEISGTTLDGLSLNLWSLRGHKNLVLIFSGRSTDNPVHELIRSVAKRYVEFRDRDSEVVAVIAGASPQSSLDLPIMDDEQNRLHRVIGAVDSSGNALAAVCIADRFGEVYDAELCADAGCLSADDLLEWLEFIEIQCPECGIAEWPLAG